jgi:hypothetical protein
MIIQEYIKIWETEPMGFASFREKLMAFCYKHGVAPDDVRIGPYVDSASCGSVTKMGICLAIEKNSE